MDKILTQKDVDNQCVINGVKVFEAGCEFEAYCKFGGSCEFEAGCSINGYLIIKWLTMANVDGSGRKLLIIKHKLGYYIEAGCFSGGLDEFCNKAAGEGKMTYVAVIKAVCNVL
jgi:hypothetical protein